jgi:glycosyltransferase involved in cell wall biosynthesis
MRPDLDIVIPVHNEQAVLGSSVERLHAYVRRTLPDLGVQLTIADNASTDNTSAIAFRLCRELPGVRLHRVERKGRGRALRSAWAASDAEVVAYMDVDLSTSLAALEPLVRPLLDGSADIAIGSRLAAGAHVERGLKRELISRTYNVLLRAILHVSFSDAQCGFKAIRRDALLPLLDRIENQNWFFDTELLYLAQQAGLRLSEVPVDWIEDRDSSVNLRATILEDLRGIRRLRGARRPTMRAVEPAVSPKALRSPDPRGPGVGTTHG